MRARRNGSKRCATTASTIHTATSAAATAPMVHASQRCLRQNDVRLSATLLPRPVPSLTTVPPAFRHRRHLPTCISGRCTNPRSHAAATPLAVHWMRPARGRVRSSPIGLPDGRLHPRMLAHIENLVKLQGVELERAKLTQAARALPVEIAQATSALTAAQSNAAAANDALSREETLRTRLDREISSHRQKTCLLYTSDAADEE